MIKLLPDSCYSQTRLRQVDCIVLHAMSAIYAPETGEPYSLQACYNLLAKLGVSAHYLIGRNQGEAWQLVPYHLIAWHAGESSWRNRLWVNNFSLGVELIGSEQLGTYTDWQYDELARWLVEQCRAHYLTWNEITTHYQISPGRKTDPWNLDLERLHSRFQQLMAQAEAPPVPEDEMPSFSLSSLGMLGTIQPTVEKPKPTHTSDGLPIVDGFDFPVGPRGEDVNVFNTHYVAAGLVNPQYFKTFNAWHPGEDWNGRGGGDSDLGDPIYAIAHGRVIDVARNIRVWGNIVLIEHALPNGTRVWSQYAHLDQIMVTGPGQIVQRGTQIGTMGKGEKTAESPRGIFTAHLHFEIRKNALPINAWSPYVKNYDAVLANYHSPTQFIQEHCPNGLEFSSGAGKRPEIIVDAPIADSSTGTFRMAEAQHWYTDAYGYQGNMVWTYASVRTETNWAEWHPKLPSAGQWEIWAHIPSHNATSTKARYLIRHADGTTETFVDQTKYYNQWVRLGKYRFVPGQAGFVRLSDLTGEAQTQQGIKVGFDAVRWVKISD